MQDCHHSDCGPPQGRADLPPVVFGFLLSDFTLRFSSLRPALVNSGATPSQKVLLFSTTRVSFFKIVFLYFFVVVFRR